MKRLQYLSKLSLAARWFLPPDEAREVSADYRELLRETSSRGEPHGPAEFGNPAQVIRPLTQPAAYRRWLAAFTAMSLCLLQPALWLFSAEYHPGMAAALLAAGAVLSLACFRRRGLARQRLPKVLPVALTCLAALSAAVLSAVLWYMAHPAIFLAMVKSAPSAHIGRLFSSILWSLGILSAAAGFVGLLLARLSDRRWRSLFILGLAVITLCALILAALRSMDLSVSYATQAAFHTRCLLTGLLGLGLAGVGLC